MDRFFWTILAAAILCVPSLAAGIHLYLSGSRLRQRGIIASANIVSIRTERYRYGRLCYIPTLEFKTASGTERVEFSCGMTFDKNIGDEMLITYLEEKPSTITLVGDNSTTNSGKLLIGFAAVTAAVALFLLFKPGM